MSFPTAGSLKIQAAMAGLAHPDYDQLPEAIKMVHTAEGFAWLGSERNRVIERETQPDFEVIE